MRTLAQFSSFCALLSSSGSTPRFSLPITTASKFFHSLEFLINNRLYSSLVCRFFSTSALSFLSTVAREQADLEEKIYTMKLLCDPFRAERDRSHVFRKRLPSRSSRSLRIPRFWCFGNDLVHGLTCYRESATLENLPRHRSTTVSPVLSFVSSSSSSFSSKGDQLRVTCASAGRTRS